MLTESSIHALIDYIRNRQNQVNLGSFNFPERAKIMVHPGTLQGDPQAIAHVSSEDAGDGVVHLNLGRLSQAIEEKNVPVNKLSNPDSLTKEELVNLIYAFVETFAHELGHIQDFQPQDSVVQVDTNQFFPGGEPVAEQAARSAVQQLSVAATNTLNKIDKSRRFNMDKRTLRILADLANDLDEAGAIRVADIVEGMMEKYAQAAPHSREARWEYYQQAISNLQAALLEAGVAENALNTVSWGSPARLSSDVKRLMEEYSRMPGGVRVDPDDPKLASLLVRVEHAFQNWKDAPKETPTEVPPVRAPSASPDLKAQWLAAHASELPGWFELGEDTSDPYVYQIYPDGRVMSKRRDDPQADAEMDITDKFADNLWAELTPYSVAESVGDRIPLGPDAGSAMEHVEPGRAAETATPDVTANLSAEEQVKKIASDAKIFEKIFWPNSSTPFGR
jgi:hypothetical protein